MLEHIKGILNGRLRTAGPNGDREIDALQQAVAALLVEAARLDGQFGAAERSRIAALLSQRFSLPVGDVDALIDTATRMSEEAVDNYAFTQRISRGLDHDEKVGIVEMLWDVAYADGTLHPYEGNLLRRVAGLLYVTDQESGAARKRVMERNGAEWKRDDGR
jgi:uncharacterized tellurite resistance protein B-like protein